MSSDPVSEIPAKVDSAISPPSPSKRRSVLRLRKWLQWSSLTRNILASIKDGGLIALIVGLILFNEQVLDYLNEKASAFMPPRPPVNVVTLLQRLNKAADTMPVEAQSASSAHNTHLSKARERAMRAEWHLLKSEDGEAISDWAIVLAARPDVDAAVSEAKSVNIAPDHRALVYTKGSARIVVPLGNAEQAIEFLPVARRAYPMATLVSLSSWCQQTEYTSPVRACR